MALASRLSSGLPPRPTKEVALALTQDVIGYLMAPVYSGQGLNRQVHGMKCDHRLKEWMGNSLCVTVNRKQEVGSRCLLNCMALPIAWRFSSARYSGAANGGTLK